MLDASKIRSFFSKRSCRLKLDTTGGISLTLVAIVAGYLAALTSSANAQNSNFSRKMAFACTTIVSVKETKCSEVTNQRLCESSFQQTERVVTCGPGCLAGNANKNMGSWLSGPWPCQWFNNKCVAARVGEGQDPLKDCWCKGNPNTGDLCKQDGAECIDILKTNCAAPPQNMPPSVPPGPKM
jgi:hypothetical protein